MVEADRSHDLGVCLQVDFVGERNAFALEVDFLVLLLFLARVVLFLAAVVAAVADLVGGILLLEHRRLDRSYHVLRLHSYLILPRLL